MSRRTNARVLAVVGVLMLAALAAAPQADASTLYACVKKGGTAHIFTKAPKCKKGETKISWNTTGPAGKNGSNGTDGTNGTNGTNGKEGAPGQPQSAVTFNQSVEVELFTEKFVTLFSLAGVSVRFQYTNALIADAVDLEATGPAGTRAVSGMVDERANHKGEATTPQQLVYNVAVGTNTKFGELVTNGSGEVDNAGHVNATITTPTAVIVIDAYIEVGSHCVASGMAFSIPT